MKTVYVPLDGSPPAELAIAPACALAAATDAKVVLLAAPTAETGSTTAAHYLDACADLLEVPARTWLVSDRSPAEAIILASDDSDAIVCMATRGLGRLRGALGSSTAEAVVRGSRRPVLLVGPALDPTWAPGVSPVVLVGVDGSSYAQGALCAAGELARELRGRVLVVEVVRPTDVVSTSPFPGADLGTLDESVALLGASGIDATYEIVDGFDPAGSLVHELGRRHASLLAVASHGRSGLNRAAFGSVSISAAQHAPCPVLVTGPAFCHEF